MEEINGYTIEGEIGEGGMAAVYKGTQISLDRPVAIKVLLKNLADNSFLLERFNRESIIIARLANPHIIHVIDRGITIQGMPYFVMEYVEGVDLQEAIKKDDLDFNRKLDLLVQICKALSYAHKNGVIHRDIKPSNVLIDSEGNARVLDFGIARFYGGSNGDAHQTRTDIVMGTLPYMSPEQQTATDQVTTLSDLYSFGVLAYELFSGCKPIGRFRLLSEIDPDFPSAVEDVIMRCLAPEPHNRPDSADEVKAVLLKLLGGAHLKAAQRERASLGSSKIEDKFSLLDVMREEKDSRVYLYQDRENRDLLVIKKRSSDSTGLTEAKLLTTLKHRNIINILGASKNDRFFIIVMEYLNGGSLKDRLLQPLPTQEALKTALEICNGLSFAHKNRIVHGNLRPGNIMFDEFGVVHLTDFGLDEHSPALGDDVLEDTAYCYRLDGESSSPRGDIFATGVIIHQLLTGVLPEWDDVNLEPGEQFLSLSKELQDLLTRMIGDKRGSLDTNIAPIIKEIESLLGTSDKTMFLDDKTSFLEEETEVETSVEQQPKKKSVFGRILLVLLLLMAINVGVVGYLVHTGEIVLDRTIVEKAKDWLWSCWDIGLNYWNDFLDIMDDLREDFPDKMEVLKKKIKELNLERFFKKE